MTMIRVAAPLRMQVVAMLRDDIFRAEFRPGTRLVERELCDRYSVSRTVIREALRQLEAEGLVSMVPNQGPVVAQLTRDEAEELFEVREVLEPMIGRLFAGRATDAQKARLVESVEAFESAPPDADADADDGAGAAREPLRAWSAPDGYYETLLDGCGNGFLADTFRRSQARIRLTRGLAFSEPGGVEASTGELRSIVDAVMADDLDAVAERSEHHVRMARERVLARLDRVPDDGS